MVHVCIPLSRGMYRHLPADTSAHPSFLRPPCISPARSCGGKRTAAAPSSRSTCKRFALTNPRSCQGWRSEEVAIPDLAGAGRTLQGAEQQSPKATDLI